jgi:heme/copper-type cytochrome/quinol oxidase subunit 2
MTATTIRTALTTFGAAALFSALIGCGSLSTTGTSTSSSAPPAAAGGLVVNVTIANGHVTPTNPTLQAKVGEPITFRVTSDAPDELHVHSVPDHKFEVAAAPNQTFKFSVEVPGDVEVELHHLNRTVATIQVRP